MWKAFCTVINFDDDGTTLAIIDQKYRDPEECCREVLRRWLWFKRPTWQKVIDCLQQAKCSQLARDIEEVVVSSSLHNSVNSATLDSNNNHLSDLATHNRSM